MHTTILCVVLEFCLDYMGGYLASIEVYEYKFGLDSFRDQVICASR